MYIGLIAHDAKKKLMQNFCIAYRGILSKHELYATGTTGRLIEEVTNLTLHKYLPGHLGGSQQLGAQIEHNQIDLLIFLRDPLAPKPHEPDAAGHKKAPGRTAGSRSGRRGKVLRTSAKAIYVRMQGSDGRSSRHYTNWPYTRSFRQCRSQ